MAVYKCNHCKKPVDVKQGTQSHHQFDEKKTIKIRVVCPHCGTANIFEVPKS